MCANCPIDHAEFDSAVEPEPIEDDDGDCEGHRDLIVGAIIYCDGVCRLGTPGY